MSLGTRFRTSPEATSLKSTVGAALIGLALLGGTLGAASAQDASPEASPMASPVATIDWIDQVVLESEATLDGDRTSVGVILGEIAEINVAEIEIRPNVILQTDNQTDAPQNVAVFSVPADFDATTFVFPADEASLPDGVTAVGGYQVAAGEQAAAVFTELVEGTYVVATDGGLTVPFAIIPVAELDVPDVFGTPAS
jgi:hypothetical protein